MQIHIELGQDGVVGTKATVTRARWLCKSAVERYACHRSAFLLGPEWINEATGMPAAAPLALQLNVAAQAAARLAGKA
jgi:hypothetical protein